MATLCSPSVNRMATSGFRGLTCPALFGKAKHDGIELGSEAHVQQSVGLVQNKHLQPAHVHAGTAPHQVRKATRCAYQHLPPRCFEALHVLDGIAARGPMTARCSHRCDTGTCKAQSTDAELCPCTHLPPTSNRLCTPGSVVKNGCVTVFI